MIQYCRYCVNAIDYNGEATDFVCTADAPCGDNGSGHMYSAKKAKRPNKCKAFEFNPLDVFFTTYGEREYKPRTKGNKQMRWSDYENGDVVLKAER